MTANAVDTPKALDDTYGVPVDIVVDAEVAVLQVLPFGNAIGGNQDVDVLFEVRIKEISVFGFGRKTGQYVVHVRLYFRRCCFAVHRAGHQCRV